LEFFIILTTILVLAFAISTDPHVRDAVLIGFIGSALGIIGIFIHAATGPAGRKLPDAASLRIFDSPIEDFVGRYDERDVCEDGECRAEAEELVHNRAQQEREARLPVNRLLSIVVVTVLSLILWLVLREPIFAAINEIAGLIITQTQHYTQPNAVMRYAEALDAEPAA
jgi:hypothetical protein